MSWNITLESNHLDFVVGMKVNLVTPSGEVVHCTIVGFDAEAKNDEDDSILVLLHNFNEINDADARTRCVDSSFYSIDETIGTQLDKLYGKDQKYLWCGPWELTPASDKTLDELINNLKNQISSNEINIQVTIDKDLPKL